MRILKLFDFKYKLKRVVKNTKRHFLLQKKKKELKLSREKQIETKEKQL